MRHKLFGLAQLRWLGLCFLLVPLETAAQAPSAKVPLEVAEALEREGRCCVMVVLESASGDSLLSTVQTSSVIDRSPVYGALQEQFLSGLPEGTYQVRYRYRFSPVVAVEIQHPDGLAGLETAPQVKAVHLDVKGSGSLDESRAVVRADELFDAGLTGEGVVVAVLDSGIDTAHPALEDSVIHEYHFLGQGTDVGPGAPDLVGHGTGVTGVIASRGGEGIPRGVAPEASVVMIRVLDQFNEGFPSDWQAALEYVVELHRADNGIEIDVVNMSLQTFALSLNACDDLYPAFHAAAQAARELGMTVVAAAGNRGNSRRMSSPACLSSVLSVGMTTDAAPEEVHLFSNRGALLDLLAPGENITSLDRGGGVATRTGTSFASPLVAGAACLLLEAKPTLTADDVLAVMRETGVMIFDRTSTREFPRIDVYAAASAVGFDCNGDDVADRVEISRSPGLDCNQNDQLDACDIASGAAIDANGDGTPDDCEARRPFRRGDVDGSGVLEIADAVQSLTYLFSGMVALPCREASDTNNDGDLNITDGVRILNFLFLGGPAPVSPGPPPGECGLDPDPVDSPGDLGCAAYESC